MRKRGSALESSSSTDSSPPPGQVLVGRLGKPNGLDGFLGLYVQPEDLTHFQPSSVVYVEDIPHTVRAIRQGKKGPQVAFEEVTDRDAAEQIRGDNVYVLEARELGEGEFWPSDLIGLEVRPGGGRVIDVAHGVSQDRLVVERDGVSFEVPFVDDLVPTVDLGEGFVVIEEIDGLSSHSDRR